LALSRQPNDGWSASAAVMTVGIRDGNAFFNVALRQAKNLKDAFVVARALVRKRELREHFEPSNLLVAGGANVQPLASP
jgi:hypothetical protein